MKRYSLVTFLIISTLLIFAQDGAKKKNIFEAMQTTDSTSGAFVKINQDERIEKVVSGTKSGLKTGSTANGYRVQVFSSNVQRVAKTEAFRIERELRSAFPDQEIYVNYTSPFWKVRIGDFKTLQEAQAFREELINEFPSLKKETYTVKDKINI